MQFYESILIGSLSSIPRWRSSLALSDSTAEAGAPRATEALVALLESTRGIVSGDNYTVENFVNVEADQGGIRLSIYAETMRTALYLSEKNGLAIQDATILHPYNRGMAKLNVRFRHTLLWT